MFRADVNVDWISIPRLLFAHLATVATRGERSQRWHHLPLCYCGSVVGESGDASPPRRTGPRGYFFEPLWWTHVYVFICSNSPEGGPIWHPSAESAARDVVLRWDAAAHHGGRGHPKRVCIPPSLVSPKPHLFRGSTRGCRRVTAPIGDLRGNDSVGQGGSMRGRVGLPKTQRCSV